MELDVGILKSPTENSKSFSESGHGNPYSFYEHFANNQSTSCDGNGALLPNSSQSQVDEANDATKTKAGLARLLKGKEKEWAAVVANKKGPLRLLDLPMDVLKEIVKEVTHTNDLASLALTHSALHNLAIPHIYARFDIVWPDAHNTAEPRTGVDALTYGLATLVMNEEVFGDARLHKYSATGGYCKKCICDHCQSVKPLAAATVQPAKRLRRGNYFSQFTRKFSLGNGPPDWVQEYLITKEGGKMLGTLVALAVARMPNLETFIWDMPTGILRDVWVSLASLNDRGNGQKSRLDKLWIRFHDNHETLSEVGSPQPTQPAQSSLGITPNHQALETNDDIGETSVLTLLEQSYRLIEHPNFSILSPLKSLSVLDIDEPAYLDEMSVLVDKSLDTLRELRIGIASTASVSGWASLASIVDNTSSPEHANEGGIATGGVVGMIMSKFYSRYAQNHSPQSFLQNAELLTKSSVVDNEEEHVSIIDTSWPISGPPQTLSTKLEAKPVAATAEALGDELVDAPLPIGGSEVIKPLQPLSIQAPPSTEMLRDEKTNQQGQPSSEKLENICHEHSTRSIPQSAVLKPKKLQLEVLEMERVVMDVRVLQESINWSVITTLTLLQCGLHEQLWKALRKAYTPRSVSFATSPSSRSISKRLSLQPSLRSISQHISRPTDSGLRSSAPDLPSMLSSSYKLNLKRIHTDAVSPALISFLKETLAPNSLEWMFLQDGREYNSPVTIDSIFRGPIRRHRGSITKLMIDSAIGKPDSARNVKRKKWMFPRELLAFITSGKMSCLKELAMAVDYKDWHFFVQKLPQITHLRSLYVPYIADHVYGPQLNAKELALQLVDVVAIRPEIELCYMGFSTTCFELLENRHLDEPSWSRFDTSTAPAHAGPGGVDVTDEDSDDDEDNNEGDEVNNSSPAVDPALEDPEDSESDLADGSTGDSEEDESASEKQRPTLKLREILFYDDKVSIFKARHGRL